jgi:hypothetical protein
MNNRVAKITEVHLGYLTVQCDSLNSMFQNSFTMCWECYVNVFTRHTVIQYNTIVKLFLKHRVSCPVDCIRTEGVN